jgi:hypothetical protein
MSDTQTETVAPETSTPTPSAETTSDHPMSGAGRRQAIILLLGVFSIWLFALWSLITIVQGGITGVEWVTGLLMLAILLIAPLVAWTLLEEAYSRVIVDDEGITYKTLSGIVLRYAWADVIGFKEKGGRSRIARFFLGEEDKREEVSSSQEDAENAADDESETALLAVRSDPALQIANPLVRFLHAQSYNGSLPIHSNLQGREALVAEINSHLITTKVEGQKTEQQ